MIVPFGPAKDSFHPNAALDLYWPMAITKLIISHKLTTPVCLPADTVTLVVKTLVSSCPLSCASDQYVILIQRRVIWLWPNIYCLAYKVSQKVIAGP